MPNFFNTEDINGALPAVIIKSVAVPSLALADATFTLINTFDTVVYTDPYHAFNAVLPDRLTAPLWASYVKISGVITMQSQNAVGSVPGRLVALAWRNGAVVPEFTSRTQQTIFAPATTDTIGILLNLPWIPIQGPGEYWSLNVATFTGQPTTITLGISTWFSAEFR